MRPAGTRALGPQRRAYADFTSAHACVLAGRFLGSWSHGLESHVPHTIQGAERLDSGWEHLLSPRLCGHEMVLCTANPCPQRDDRHRESPATSTRPPPSFRGEADMAMNATKPTASGAGAVSTGGKAAVGDSIWTPDTTRNQTPSSWQC